MAALIVDLSEVTVAKVCNMAAIEQRSPAEMVRLLAEEALKMREFPQITFADGPSGRRAVFINGPEVWAILEPYIVWRKNWQILRDSYPERDEALLRTAIRYYEAYPAEIEARIALNSQE